MSFGHQPDVNRHYSPGNPSPHAHLDDEELAVVLRHELTHYQHRDLLIKLLGIAAASIHWFNPIVRLCIHALQTNGESCCDETVLQDQGLDYRRFYGEIVIGMIAPKSRMQTALSTCFYTDKLNMKRRLNVIMDTKKKRKALSAAAVAAAAGLTLLSGSIIAAPAASNTSALIGMDEAKSIALNSAGLAEKDVTFIKTKLDKDNGRYEYDIEFYSKNVEYDYEIDAVSGKILESDYDIEHYFIPGAQPANHKAADSNAYIGETKAKSIALADAGLNESNVTFSKIKLDYDDGKDVYDIEFYGKNIKYDYEIDAVSGEIRERDRDYKIDAVPAATSNIAAYTNGIGEARAKTVALEHAGVKEADIKHLKVKLDYEDGRRIYEVEFYSGQTEYEYEIDASSGAILKWDIDYDD